jgi:hypothetical protein
MNKMNVDIWPMDVSDLSTCETTSSKGRRLRRNLSGDSSAASNGSSIPSRRVPRAERRKGRRKSPKKAPSSEKSHAASIDTKRQSYGPSLVDCMFPANPTAPGGSTAGPPLQRTATADTILASGSRGPRSVTIKINIRRKPRRNSASDLFHDCHDASDFRRQPRRKSSNDLFDDSDDASDDGSTTISSGPSLRRRSTADALPTYTNRRRNRSPKTEMPAPPIRRSLTDSGSLHCRAPLIPQRQGSGPESLADRDCRAPLIPKRQGSVPESPAAPLCHHRPHYSCAMDNSLTSATEREVEYYIKSEFAVGQVRDVGRRESYDADDDEFTDTAPPLLRMRTADSLPMIPMRRCSVSCDATQLSASCSDNEYPLNRWGTTR